MTFSIFNTVFLLLLLNAQDIPKAQQTFNFFINTNPVLPPFTIVASGSLSFTWEWDSCAGFKNGSNNTVTSQRTATGCADINGNALSPPTDMAVVFPNGFDVVQLTGREGNNQNLLQSVGNSAKFAGGKSFTLSNVGSIKSDYYTFTLSAKDSNGNIVRGQSPTFGIQGVGPLPALGSLKLHTPMTGSFWLANTKYRIRFEVGATKLIPDAYHVDLLTPNDVLVARVLEAAIPFSKDDLLGPNNPLNYTIWDVPKELTNRQFKIRVTGVGLRDQTTIVDFTDPPTVTSGVFYIGPAKPDAIK